MKPSKITKEPMALLCTSRYNYKIVINYINISTTIKLYYKYKNHINCYCISTS